MQASRQVDSIVNMAITSATQLTIPHLQGCGTLSIADTFQAQKPGIAGVLKDPDIKNTPMN